MTSVAAAEDWARGLDELAERIAPRFCRIEARQRARSYLGGLLAPLERKNGWHLAEAAGDASPDSVQDFRKRHPISHLEQMIVTRENGEAVWAEPRIDQAA